MTGRLETLITHLCSSGMCVSLAIFAFVCVCVCVCDRERERERISE